MLFYVTNIQHEVSNLMAVAKLLLLLSELFSAPIRFESKQLRTSLHLINLSQQH